MSESNGMGNSPQEKLLRKKEVAERLACSLRTVDRLVNAGRLTRVKILGGIRFRFSQVQILMNGGKHDFQS
jgi:excisionase family DNA binding protein